MKATGLSPLFGAALACAALSCVSTSTPEGSSGNTGGEPLALVDGAEGLTVALERTSFAAMKSAPIAAAAMRYPEAKLALEPAAPMSLTAADGTGLRLVSLEARAVIDGPLAFTELQMRFENPLDRTIEGRFAITLPEGAAISRLAMRLEQGWQEAEVVERQAARRAYEDFLHRRQDPALLEKEAGNEFRARIFPIPARSHKDIIISYSQEMTGAEAAYRLPLRGLPAVDSLRVTAMLGKGEAKGMSYKPVTMEQRGTQPSEDFVVAVPGAIQGLRHQALVAARVRPQLSADTAAPTGLVVMFDTSASRAPGFARGVADLGRLVEAFRAAHGDAMTLTVAAFDQAVTPVYHGKAGGFGQAALDALLARRPLGASNLHAALAFAGANAAKAGQRVVLITDAIATAGPSEGDELRAAVQALRGQVNRLDVVLAGGIRDRELAERLVRGLLPADGVVLDAAQPAAELARRIGQTTVSGVAVAVDGAAWVWPNRLDGVQPGDEVLVFAELDNPGVLPAGQALSVRLSGPVGEGGSQTVSVPLSEVEEPLIERATARALIAMMAGQRDSLGDEPGAAAKSKQLEQQMVELSVRHRVLSDYTALLVLESEADYARYGIDRNALADILAVGPNGIEVRRRSQPVLLMAQTQPAKKPALAEKKKTGGRADRSGYAEENGDTGEYELRDAFDGAKTEAAPGDGEMALAEESDDDMAEGGVAGGSVGAAAGAASGESFGRGGLARQEAPAATAAPAAPPPPAEVAAEPEPAADRAMRRRPSRRPSPRPATRAMRRVEQSRAASSQALAAEERAVDEERAAAEERVAADVPQGPPPLTGPLAEVMQKIESGQREAAAVQALDWRTKDPGDVMALIALGESLEALGRVELAARAYGSIIDLFPSRADMRRFAGERLERLGAGGANLAADSYHKAVAQRPDHLTGHRLLAYALLRQGHYDRAFDAAMAGLARDYPSGRFDGGKRILREDLGLIAAAWLKAEPSARATVESRLSSAGAELATMPSTRFVLTWETDANDVDFHIHDSKGGHAYYSDRRLPSGGELYADVTTGYGPECFTIPGTPQAGPYRVRLHYYSR
ncbi:VIT domain-containing protein [Haliangium sp.]